MGLRCLPRSIGESHCRDIGIRRAEVQKCFPVLKNREAKANLCQYDMQVELWSPRKADLSPFLLTRMFPEHDLYILQKLPLQWEVARCQDLYVLPKPLLLATLPPPNIVRFHIRGNIYDTGLGACC